MIVVDVAAAVREAATAMRINNRTSQLGPRSSEYNSRPAMRITTIAKNLSWPESSVFNGLAPRDMAVRCFRDSFWRRRQLTCLSLRLPLLASSSYCECVLGGRERELCAILQAPIAPAGNRPNPNTMNAPSISKSAFSAKRLQESHPN